MKKTLTLLALLLCSNLTFAQFTTSGSNLYHTGGNVGIGTSTPSFKLDVQGRLRLFATGTDRATAHFFSQGTGEAGIYFDASNGDGVGSDYGGLVQLDNLEVRLSNFGLNPIHLMTNSDYRLTVTGNGNVGIGTTSPQAKLHIQNGSLQIGSSTQNGMLYMGGGKGYTGIGSTRSDAGLILGKNIYAKYADASNNAKAYVGESASWGFSGIKLGMNGQIDFFGKSGSVVTDEVANDVQNIKMTVSTAGNVGIGTASPVAKLHLHENIDGSFNGLIIDNRKAYGIGSGINETSRIVLSLSENNTPNPLNRIFGVIEAGTISETSSINGRLSFYVRNNGSEEEKLRINNDGNVGIGTTSPTEKLEVNGTIRTKKVKVEATGWPDYVFADSYQLMPIGQLEEYIKANKHLPEVPSAKAIETNGLDLGEMDAKLLKKVEELTLYLIEMKKEIEVLKQENKTLKEKVGG